MRKFLLLSGFIASLMSTSVTNADYDPILEAQEAAKAKATATERARKDAEAQALRHRAEIQAYRGFLGAEAEGKSDTEVRELYKQRTEQIQKSALEANTKGMEQYKKLAKEASENQAKWQADGNQAAVEMTGKSISELSQMSDAELEAMEKELMEKYGSQE